MFAVGKRYEAVDESNETPSPRRVEVGPHGGRGSEFLPREAEEYRLEVDASWAGIPGYKFRVKAIGNELL